jgi:hypothetical protein
MVLQRKGIVAGYMTLGLLGPGLQSPTGAKPSPSKGEGIYVDSVAAAVTGKVIDSLNGRPLSRARVSLDADPRRSAETDSKGHFRIEKVAVGEHTIRVQHPLLDSIGYMLTDKVRVDSAGAVIDLAVPSPRSLLANYCPGAADTAHSVIVGRVNYSSGDSAASGATVKAAWSTLVNDGRKLVTEKRQLATTTDSVGHYRLCGLPSQVDAKVSAATGLLSSGGIATSVVKVPFVVRLLRVGRAELARAADSGAAGWDSTAKTEIFMTGRASVSGRVTTAEGRPMSGATVGIRGAARTARTGRDGTFSISGLPAGTQSLFVRAIGYYAVDSTVELSDTKPATIQMVLSVPIMEAVNVQTSSDSALQHTGFGRRRERGLGKFLVSEQIMSRPVTRISEVFSAFGISAVRLGSDRSGKLVFVDSRGGSNACVNVYLDRFLYRALLPADLDLIVDIEDVAAMEVYTRSTTPTEFVPVGTSLDRAVDCATILIWTKFMVKQR